MAEIVGNFRSENPTRTSSVYRPIFDILRVRPHQITKWALMRYLYSSINCSDLIYRLYLGTQSSMHAKDFTSIILWSTINDSSDGKIIEDFSTVFPRIGVAVLSVDLIIKSINGGNLSAFGDKYLDSWLPRRRVMRSGYLTLRQRRYSNVSTEW